MSQERIDIVEAHLRRAWAFATELIPGPSSYGDHMQARARLVQTYTEALLTERSNAQLSGNLLPPKENP